jgi:hypothetical protein
MPKAPPLAVLARHLPERRNTMAKFMFVYRRAGYLTAEEKQRQLPKWEAWIAEGFQKGWLLDPGDGLMPEGRVVKAKNVVTDGPFAEAKEVVGGFSVVQADSIQAAAALAEGCPVLLTGGSVEVRQLMGHTFKK